MKRNLSITRATKLTLFLFIICIVTLYSCDKEGGLGQRGNAPKNITEKTLVLAKSNGGVYLSVEHYDKSKCFINNTTVDYVKYPPVYSYKRIGDNEAVYNLEATKVTYIPYYQTNHYSSFTFVIGLTFTSASSGTYDGIETNSKGEDKKISGTFTLK